MSIPPRDQTSPQAAHTDRPGVGELIRARRKALGLSVAALAEQVGCAQPYLSMVENGQRGAPREPLLRALELTLGLRSNTLINAARWARAPGEIKRDITVLRTALHTTERGVQTLLDRIRRQGIDAVYRSGELAALIERIDPEGGGAEVSAVRSSLDRVLPLEVPLINKVTAGYPADFTDLGYPARVADEYVRCPDLHDPDAFAARVVGNSMEPDYREGDIVVFSPARDVRNGADCFVRLEPDHESTFKRVYFEQDHDGAELIRIQPINNAYAPRTVPREQVAGLYAAVSVTRSVG